MKIHNNNAESPNPVDSKASQYPDYSDYGDYSDSGGWGDAWNDGSSHSDTWSDSGWPVRK